MLFLLLFAGHETTTHLISGSVYELVRNPGLRDWLEQDWSRAGLAVEEFLRFVSPVQFTKPRYVRRDVELGGVRLKKGDKIMAMLAAANLDPHANPHAEKLDLERSIENLKDAIEHINKTSEERFKKAFEAIAERFSKLFPARTG